MIDQPTMRALGLAPRGLVRYRVVGRQLIIEADGRSPDNSPDKPINKRIELSMEQVIGRLDAHCFGETEIRRLGYRGRGLLFLAHASAGRFEARHNAVLRSLLARREAQPRIRRGESWADSVDAVIAEHGDLSDAVGSQPPEVNGTTR